MEDDMKPDVLSPMIAVPAHHVSSSSADCGMQMLGVSEAMCALQHTLQRAARSPLTVLINGETGTGKELAARKLHALSARADQAFIALNMAAIPSELLESELFGHQRGAFTGAMQQRIGRFQQADGGTLFLDEIGDMPLALQTRLLRVLADGEFYPVGASHPVRVNVRIVAATHQNLEQRVRDGLFREDLFHRLNVIRIHMPPLRARRDDIPMLLGHYLCQAASALNEQEKQLSAELVDYLYAFNWPGNVRQLENLCHWLVVMSCDAQLSLDDLPQEIRPNPVAAVQDIDWYGAVGQWAELQFKAGRHNVAKQALSKIEQILIDSALRYSNGQRQLAAKRLGYGRNTLTRKIRELQIQE
jgi:two-component system, NtrC family, nitrogen regulation response regulator GlnG